MTLTGTIKKYDDERGFGFLRPSDGHHDIFFHISDFLPKGAQPVVGMTVSYSEGVDDRYGKPKALNVTEIDAPPSTAKPETLRKTTGNDPWWQ